jgi:hypothetical protein
METTQREALTAELDAAKLEMRRCMGGVDPAGCVAAAERVSVLRLQLRDNTAMFAHFARVMAAPKRVPARHRAS